MSFHFEDAEGHVFNRQNRRPGREDGNADFRNVKPITAEEWKAIPSCAPMGLGKSFEPADRIAFDVPIKYTTLQDIELIDVDPDYVRCCTWCPMRFIAWWYIPILLVFWLPLLPVVIVVYMVAGFMSNFMFQEYTKGWGMLTLFSLLSYIALPINYVLRKPWYEPNLGIWRYVPLWYNSRTVVEGTQTMLETFQYGFFFKITSSLSARLGQFLMDVFPVVADAITPPYTNELGGTRGLLPTKADRKYLHTIIECDENLKEDWDSIKQHGNEHDKAILEDFNKNLAELFRRQKTTPGEDDYEEIHNEKVSLMYCAFISFVHPTFFQSQELTKPLDCKDLDALNFVSLYGRNDKQKKAFRRKNSPLLKSVWLRKNTKDGDETGEYEEHFPPLYMFTKEEQESFGTGGMTQKGTNPKWTGPVRHKEEASLEFLGYITYEHAIKMIDKLEKELKQTSLIKYEQDLLQRRITAQKKENAGKEHYSPCSKVKNMCDFTIPFLEEGDCDWAIASAHPRMNSHPLFRIFGTLFLRLHNQYARTLYQRSKNNKPEKPPDWDTVFTQARIRVLIAVFAFARNVLGKVYIEFYTPRDYNLYDYELQNSPLNWRMMRQGYTAVAFETKISYTFHEFLPEHMKIIGVNGVNGELVDGNPANFRDISLADWCDYCVNTPSGRITTRNTPSWMVHNITVYVKLSRKFGLQRYTAYRELLGWPTLESFEEFNCSKKDRDLLKEMYDDDINKMDLLVGLYCDTCHLEGVKGVLDFLPPMMHTFVVQGLSFLVIANPVHDKQFISRIGLTPEDRNFFGQSLTELLRFPLPEMQETTFNRHDCLVNLEKATRSSWLTNQRSIRVYGSNR